jgi:hypothetical protein
LSNADPGAVPGLPYQPLRECKPFPPGSHSASLGKVEREKGGAMYVGLGTILLIVLIILLLVWVF